MVLSSMDSMLRQCVDDCLDCYRICTETLVYCLDQGGSRSEISLLKLLSACAEVCKANVNVMTLNAFMHFKTCEATAELSEKCAQACEHYQDDRILQQCAAACHRCAQSCRQNTSLFYMEEFTHPAHPRKSI